jgi:hypothetical protein
MKEINDWQELQGTAKANFPSLFILILIIIHLEKFTFEVFFNRKIALSSEHRPFESVISSPD